MKTKTEHAPTPWVLSEYDGLVIYAGEDKEQTIATFEDSGDAIRCIRAVNSHEALLEAAKEMFDVVARKVHGGAKAEWHQVIAQAGGQ